MQKARLLLGLFLLAGSVQGQGVPYFSNVFTSANSAPPGSQTTMFTVPFSTVTVCGAVPVGNPCTNTVVIYANAAMTVTAHNPITTDVHGKFNFWAPTGTYSYSLKSASGTLLGTYYFTLGGSGGGSSIALQHNGTAVANQNVLNFNDTTPAAPAGNVNVVFGSDSTGKLSAWVPIGGSSFSLTTSGTSGAATYASSVLNIPDYTYTLTVPKITALGPLTNDTSGSAAKIGGVAVSGVPGIGQVFVATSPTAASWQTLSATGGISGQTTNCGLKANSATTSNASLPICDNGTTTTASHPFAVADGTGHAGSIDITAGTDPGAAPASSIRIYAPTSITPYKIKVPGAQGTGALTNDGSGNLAWTTSSGGTVTSVTSADANATIATTTTTPVITIVSAPKLTAAGTSCASGQFASGVDASGNALCSTLPTQPASQYIAPQAIAGCGVEYVSGLTYTVGACSYSVNGQLYSSPLTNITLSAADPTNPEIDVIYVDTTGTVHFIAGTPAVTPQQPVVDPSTQLQLTFVLVPATATTPANTTTVLIYDENVEWTSAKGGTSSANVNLASTNNPYHGTIDTEFGAGGTVASTTFAQYTKPAAGTVTLGNYNTLTFYLRNKAAWPKTRSITVQWFNGATALGTPVVMSNGAFGLDATGNITSYQQISIPTSTFGIAGTPATTVKFTVTGSGANLTGFYLDQVTLQGGNGGVVLPTTLMNYRGAWNTTATYSPNDTVVGGGIGYVAIASNTNTAVTNTAFWTPLAAPPGTGTVTSVSVTTANGVSGSVATATTTPAITLTLGAITPTSTNGVSAATMAFMDATSSVQTQLNGKQATITNLPNANLAVQTANTVLGALTATTPSGLAVPSCSGASSALTWTSGTGFGCNTITPGTGTVTTTGSPASGNLAKFSGSTSVTNGDLTGDVTTSGGLATTVAAVGGTASATIKARGFGTSFGDTGGSALTSGSVVYMTVPYACTIAAWNMTLDAGTATIDIWKIATGTAVPTVANTITASALPAISTGTAKHSTTLTGWTTSVALNDIFAFKLNAVSTAKFVEVDLQCNQ